MSGKRLKVALLVETYAPSMGYLQNVLPEYMSQLGMEVHLITMDLMPYYQNSATGSHAGLAEDRLTPGTTTVAGGFTIHVLPHKKVFGYMRMVGLLSKLREIRPDIVQTMAAIGWIPIDAAIGKLLLGYKLFTGNHNAASCFRPMVDGYQTFRERFIDRSLRYLPGMMVSFLTTKCYAVTSDCAEIAHKYFGVQKVKVEVMHLGVDTKAFRPVISDEDVASRSMVREGLGISEDEIVCIYTGKLSAQKNALIIAQAVNILRARGKSFQGLFIGSGEEAGNIAAIPGSTVISQIPYRQLAKYYRAADIAVWSGNESISTLDAAACGLPVIISDAVGYRDHVEGNGLVFKYGDVEDLCRLLLHLTDPGIRERLGAHGASKMLNGWSWELRARQRLSDYQAALGR